MCPHKQNAIGAAELKGASNSSCMAYIQSVLQKSEERCYSWHENQLVPNHTPTVAILCTAIAVKIDNVTWSLALGSATT